MVSAFPIRPTVGWAARVRKAIHTPAYRAFCAQLRERREAAGLTQAELAATLHVTQSFVSSYEAGGRRLDLVELDQISAALGTTLGEVVAEFNPRR